MKPKVTIERAKAVVRVGELMQDISNPGRMPSEAECTKVRRAAKTLELAKCALLDYIGEPSQESFRSVAYERRYLRDPMFNSKQVVRFLMVLGILHGSDQTARRQYNRLIHQGKLTHPAADFQSFVQDVIARTDDTIEYEHLERGFINWFPRKKEAIKRAFGE